MIPALTIAAATQQDIPALHQLINSAYRGDSSRAGWTTEADLLGGIRITTEGLQETFEKPGATILKAENEDGELIGCVYLEQLPDALYLGMLTVNPQLQNSGIGKKLLFAGEDLAHEKKLPKMRMSVISARDTLIAWYQRHGYQPTGAKQPFPNDPKFGEPKQPLEFIVLEKALSHL